ncbi:erythromycin esterase [Paramicrobacterium humi]|uniref:Erythromycin esterase n=1 Tax=Paramicrobacterium humi TaxID=640635 RepID=A0A1H4N425_9MICO|nr:erythromycin esterase family protein [Microbacterium humi]SEB89342.1 erythromycin esterase [Microbacterium humi]
MPETDDNTLPRWLRAHGHQLATLDPDAEDDRDLEPLLEIVGHARVVALGESMHRSHEFLALRNRLFRFLARRAGFTALVLESGFPEGFALDAWIGAGGAGLRSILNDAVTYHFGKCQETLDQAAWMREQAANGARSVRYYGMDVPDSAASAAPAVRLATEVLERVDPSFAAAVRNRLLPRFGYLPADRSGLARAAPAIHAYLALPEAERNAITAGIAGLAQRIRAKRLDYAVIDAEGTEIALHSAEVAVAADAFLAAMADGPTRTWSPANIRDAAMAETVQWILEREPRVLVFAANGHVRKTAYLAPPFVTQPMSTMGEHLADRLGDDLLVIGTTFGGGTAWLHRPGPDDPEGHSTPFTEELADADPASLDAALADAELGSFFVDLRSAPAEVAAALDATSGRRNGPYIEPADVRRSFDAIVHVDRISPWHTWIDAHGHWE